MSGIDRVINYDKRLENSIILELTFSTICVLLYKQEKEEDQG